MRFFRKKQYNYSVANFGNNHSIVFQMKKVLVFSLITAAFAVPAFAQTTKFEGYSVAMSAAVLDGNINLQQTDTPSVSFGRTRVSTALDVAYSKAVNSNWVLGFGASAALDDPGIVDVVMLSGKLKGQKSLYVQPAYVLTSSTAVYAKVAYNSANIEIGAGMNPGSESISNSIHGTGLGLGIKSFLSDNMFVQVEMMNTNYGAFTSDVVGGAGSAASFTPSTKSVGFAIGYRF